MYRNVCNSVRCPHTLTYYSKHCSKGLFHYCRKIFWNDWEYCNARIETANMDGSDRKILIQLDKNFTHCNLSCQGDETAEDYTRTCLKKWPNQMELNYSSNELYWVDGFRDNLESVKVDGSNFRVVLRNVTHCFGLGLDNEDVYYTSWLQSNTGFSLWKWHNSPSSVSKLLRHDITGRPMDVAIVRRNKRPSGRESVYYSQSCHTVTRTFNDPR